MKTLENLLKDADNLSSGDKLDLEQVESLIRASWDAAEKATARECQRIGDYCTETNLVRDEIAARFNLEEGA
jgi:hypothetical protein